MIATLSVDGYAGNVEIVEGAETNRNFTDVGIYKFDLYINALSHNIGDGDSFYAKARIDDIIIEIIE